MPNTDVIVYTPLHEEYESLQLRFQPTEDVNGDNYTGYRSVGPGGENVLVVVGFEWGNGHAHSVMKEVFAAHTCKMAVCIGIGGAISKDAKLGDVFYSRQVLDLTQRLKQEKDKKGVSRIKYDPETYPSSEPIAKALDRAKMSAVGTPAYKGWKEACALVNEGRLVGVDTKSLGNPPNYFFTPEAGSAKIASTNMVLADTQAVEDVKDCGRKIACVDTESAGFAQACNDDGTIPHIVIRGISDMADETKKLTEAKFKNVFRGVAADNAALFLKHNMSSMLSAVTTCKEDHPDNVPSNSIDPLQNAVSKNENSIREELSRRSVIFKALEHEYKMPVPRLRPDHAERGEKKQLPEEEVEDILTRENRVLIDVPKHYPDTALPWLFSHLLTQSGLHGRYTIPVCIKWSEFGPPKNNLDAQLAAKNLEKTKNNDSYQIVFVFIDAKLTSKTKADFLSKEFSTYNNASVLIFSDRNDVGIYENEIQNLFKPTTYKIEGISFSSISNYVRENFGMSMPESEVVAKRLISTFQNYRLKVHPTYLASIQKDTVQTFIDANQRGELIELAVAGLLSILVSGDKSKVVLRRGTREKFLSKLAVSIYSEKENYNRNSLENYVSEYATEMGFDIVPRQFIDLFVDNGIINIINDEVSIGIPVIQTYMLAKGLVDDPKSALPYFDLENGIVDLSTFDLYCEFSDDNSLYSYLSDHLDNSIEFFSKKIEKYDTVIEDAEYESHLLDKTLVISDVFDDISKKASELVEVTNLLSEKQAKLDVQSEIAQSKSARNVDISDPDEFNNEHIGVARFVAAAIMLGAAAEKMTDIDKLDVISKLLKLGRLIVTDLLTLYSKFDVEAVVAEVMDKIKEDREVDFDDEDAVADFRKFVELVVAEWEFQQAANPVGTLLSVLCESGRTNVLLSQLDRTKTSNKLEEFFRVGWAFDMDPVAKRGLPKEMSKKMGRARFLRMMFGTFMVNRLYWYHHGRPSKEAIVNGVDEIFKPLSLTSGVDLDKTEE